MLGEDALEFLGSEVVNAAIRQAAPSLLNTMVDMLKEWKRAKHPSLGDLREICDFLETFIIDQASSHDSTARYRFPESTRKSTFIRKDMSANEIADLWFRTDTKIWKERVTPVADEWRRLMPNVGPYFRGELSAELDYAHDEIPKSHRHPLFRNVHPFIMTYPVKRDLLKSDDPVGELLNISIDGWKIFSDNEYTLFRGGTVLRVRNQAYAQGVFTITKKAMFWSNSIRHENVHLWRCVMVTGYMNNVEVTNIGIPVWADAKDEYLDHVRTWMSEFRVLNADAPP